MGEYVLSGNVHKSWVIPLLIIFVLAIVVGVLGFLFSKSYVVDYWKTQYVVTKSFDTLQEAQDYQSLIVTDVKTLNADSNISLFVSKDNKFVVSGIVTSEKSFPYGDNSPPMNPIIVEIVGALLGWCIGVFIMVKLFARG